MHVHVHPTTTSCDVCPMAVSLLPTVSVAVTWDTARCFASLTAAQRWSFAAAHVTLLSRFRRLTAATMSANVSTAEPEHDSLGCLVKEMTDHRCFIVPQRGCQLMALFFLTVAVFTEPWSEMSSLLHYITKVLCCFKQCHIRSI